jgi:hypothetical protein
MSDTTSAMWLLYMSSVLRKAVGNTRRCGASFAVKGNWSRNSLFSGSAKRLDRSGNRSRRETPPGFFFHGIVEVLEGPDHRRLIGLGLFQEGPGHTEGDLEMGIGRHEFGEHAGGRQVAHLCHLFEDGPVGFVPEELVPLRVETKGLVELKVACNQGHGRETSFRLITPPNCNRKDRAMSTIDKGTPGME